MNQKGFIPLVIIILVAGLAAIGVGYYFIQRSSGETTVQQIPLPSGSDQPTASASASNHPTNTPIAKPSSTVTPSATSTTSPTSSPLSAASPTNSPTNEPVPTGPIHLADNKQVSIDHIKVVPLILRPKDQAAPDMAKWQQAVTPWYQSVVTFWQNSLYNKTSITVAPYPTAIQGNLNTGDYTYDTAYTDVVTQLSQQDAFKPYFNGSTKEFLVLWIYVLTSDQNYYKDYARGGHNNIGTAVGPLDQDFNLLSSSRGGLPAEEAHEIGHTLGLQHSSDDPTIRAKYLQNGIWTSNCDLMVGTGVTQHPNFFDGDTLSDVECIIPEQKALFFN